MTAAKKDSIAVLVWLQKQHPKLHVTAEIDRAWVWVTEDLRGNENKAIRDSLKDFGFRFARKGHRLPSGKVGMWAHHGNKPMPFRKKGKPNTTPRPHSTETIQSHTEAPPVAALDASDQEALAFACE